MTKEPTGLLQAGDPRATRVVPTSGHLTPAAAPATVESTDMDHIFFFYRNPA
jgi:hypothetical protein